MKKNLQPISVISSETGIPKGTQILHFGSLDGDVAQVGVVEANRVSMGGIGKGVLDVVITNEDLTTTYLKPNRPFVVIKPPEGV